MRAPQAPQARPGLLRCPHGQSHLLRRLTSLRAEDVNLTPGEAMDCEEAGSILAFRLNLPSFAETKASLSKERVMQDERRSNFRVEWNGEAKITVKGRVVCSCVVSNLSNGGAKLSKVDASAKLPDLFEILLLNQESPRLCRVTWRRDSEVGVQFAEATPTPTARPAPAKAKAVPV